MNFTLTKLGSTFLVIIAIAFVYFAYSALGGTFLNITLNTNPDLQRGLVGHWSFDGKDDTNAGDSGAWYDTDYGFKRAITITAGGTSGGAATTTTNGYAILATTTLSTLAATTSGGNVEFLDGRDIIFTDDDDTTLLDFEIESYDNTTGEIVAWIEVESISSTTAQTFNMYYGNATTTDKSDAEGVWNSTYAGVWHMAEDPSVTTDGSCKGQGTTCDSTSNNNDGTSAGTMPTGDQVAGQVDGSLDFATSTADYIDIGTWNLSGSSLSLSAWFKVSPDENGINRCGGRIISKAAGSAEADHYWMMNVCGANGDPVSAEFRTRIKAGGTTTTLVTTDDPIFEDIWYYGVSVYDGTDIILYLDGVEQIRTAKTGAVGTSANQVTIARNGDETNAADGNYFSGQLDEVRIYNTALHPMDILTDYNMMVDNSTFLSFGAETAYTGGTATDTSGQGTSGTINLMQKRQGVLGQALEFNGADDYVAVGNAGSGIKTIAFWMKPDDATTKKIIDIDGTDQIEIDASGALTATSFPGTTSIYITGSSASVATATSTWQHVVVTDTTGVNASAMDIGRVSGGTAWDWYDKDYKYKKYVSIITYL